MVERDPHGIQRRVAGRHDFRLDGMRDILWRAAGASVLDVGCNRGAVGLDFAHHGATTVHGLDAYERGIETAQEMFADLRAVESVFSVVDLTSRPALQGFLALRPDGYDIVLLLAVLHKLQRRMSDAAVRTFLTDLARVTNGFLAWRATSDKPDENHAEMALLDDVLRPLGLVRVHTSYLSEELGICAIWGRRWAGAKGNPT